MSKKPAFHAGIRFGIGNATGKKLRSLSAQRSGSERSTGNNQSCLKTAISLTGAEMRRGRLLKGDFSGRRLLFGGAHSIARVLKEEAHGTLRIVP